MSWVKAHDRVLVVGAVSLTMARLNRALGPALDIARDEVEALLKESAYFEGATFSWATVMVRLGLVDATTPAHQRVSRKYGTVDLSIEIDTHGVRYADSSTISGIMKRALLTALIHAGKKHGRPTESLLQALAELEP